MDVNQQEEEDVPAHTSEQFSPCPICQEALGESPRKLQREPTAYRRRSIASTVVSFLLAALVVAGGGLRARAAQKSARQEAVEFLLGAMRIYGVDTANEHRLASAMMHSGDYTGLKLAVRTAFLETPVPADEVLHEMLRYVTENRIWASYKSLHNQAVAATGQ